MSDHGAEGRDDATVETWRLAESLSRAASPDRAGDLGPTDRVECSPDPQSTREFNAGDGHEPTALEPTGTERCGVEPTQTSRPSQNESECRYRIIAYHDGGGLGEIYRAEDLELYREVALKEIRERHASDTQARARFLLEAEVIGRLEHPGIVPIYGRGHHPDGRPYYAMRFIKGESLREAIGRLHEGQAGRSRSEQELRFRGLLGRIVDTCNAIEYAHSRQILHRDIKPGNIMLGRFGETLVVDWGLAKVLDRAEDEPGTVADDPLILRASLDVEPTRLNKAMGTLRYMSPEQAAGKLDQVGPGSDVFSLGATLYCLLTGRSPYAGSDLVELKDHARKAQFPPPRKVRPEIPAPLESICLKAMAVEPVGRYASPRAMAGDIERWLADEPVSAHDYSFSERALRWVRGHRPLVAAAAALLCTTTIALAVSLVAIRSGQTRAEAGFQIASEAVDQMLARVGSEKLLYLPQMTELRSDLGDDAAIFNKRLLVLDPGNPGLKWTYAITCMKAANNHLVAGRLDRLLRYYDEEIIPTYRTLIAEYPQKLGYRNALSWAQLEKAEALQKSGEVRPSLEQFEEARREAERLHLAEPGSADYRYTLARARLLHGEVLTQVGEYEQACAGFDRGIELLAPLVAATPDSEMFRRHLFYLYCLRGVVAAETCDSSGAKQAFFRSGELLDEWVKQPKASRVEADFCRAILLNEQGRWLASRPESSDSAVSTHDRALIMMEALCRDYPDMPEYKIERAWSLLNRGLARSIAGVEGLERAEADFESAAKILGPVTIDHPRMVRGLSVLGMARGALGEALLDRGCLEPAIDQLKQAIWHQQQCLGKNEASPRDREALDTHQTNLRRAEVEQPRKPSGG